MRISDWSSDVCSSDLLHVLRKKRWHLDLDAPDAAVFPLNLPVLPDPAGRRAICHEISPKLGTAYRNRITEAIRNPVTGGGRSRRLAGRLYPRRSARAGDLLEAVAVELVAEIAAADEHRRIERADVVFLGPADRAAEAAGLAPGGRRRLAAALLAVQAVVQPVDLMHGEAVGLLLRAGRPRGRRGRRRHQFRLRPRLAHLLWRLRRGAGRDRKSVV